MSGIICIETEWQITKQRNRLNLNTEPLMKFIAEMYQVPYLYRRVATLGELAYYLQQFQKQEYRKYDVLYFSMHGNTHAIYLEGEKDPVTLETLADIGGDVFAGRYVHFSSCRTLLGAVTPIEHFQQTTRAMYVSGYTKSVAGDLSAIHDIALFGIFFSSKKTVAMFRKLEKLYGDLGRQLGFLYR